MSDLSKFTSQIDSNKSKLIQRLADAVAIPSVSGDASYRKHVDEMAHWLVKELDAIGATSTLKELGNQTLEGKQVKLPPAILSDLGNDPKKKTILIYGVSKKFFSMGGVKEVVSEDLTKIRMFPIRSFSFS